MTTYTDDESDPIITAASLELHGKRGAVYGPLDFVMPHAETPLAIVGEGGSGRSCLLLTLAGRMKPGPSSHLVVLGHELPAHRRAVQKIAAIANIDDVDNLDSATTIGAHINERLALETPWYRPTPKSHADLLAPAFGDLPIPALTTMARDLTELDTMLVRIGLALLQKPRLLLIDDIDTLESPSDREKLVARLTAIATDGTAIVAAATDIAYARTLTTSVIAL